MAEGSNDIYSDIDPKHFDDEAAPATPEAASEATEVEQVEGEAAEAVEAAAEPEATDETTGEAAGGEDEGKDGQTTVGTAETPTEPAGATAGTTSPAATPAADPDQAARDARTARLHAISTEIAALEKRIDSDDYDPYVDGKALNKLQIEERRLEKEATDERIAAAEQKAAAAKEDAEYRAFWADFATKNPEVGTRAEAIWQEELAKAMAEKEIAHDPAAVRFWARKNFEHRIGILKGQAREKSAEPAKKPVAAPPKGSGRIIPAGAAGRTVKTPQSAEDELVATAGPGINKILR